MTTETVFEVHATNFTTTLYRASGEPGFPVEPFEHSERAARIGYVRFFRELGVQEAENVKAALVKHFGPNVRVTCRVENGAGEACPEATEEARGWTNRQ